MRVKKIILICNILFISIFCLTSIHAAGLSYTETKNTAVDYGNFKHLTIEGKTKEGSLSEANQVMSFVSFAQKSNLEMVHWNYNTGNKWTNRNVLDLARDYESKNPGHKVMAGINGDFFNMASPYEPMDTQITDYEVIRSGYDYFDTVGFDSQNQMITRRESFSFSDKFYIKILDSEGYMIKEFKADRSNALPESNQTSVYTPGYLPDIDCQGNSCYNVSKASYVKSEGAMTKYFYLFKGKIDNTDKIIPQLQPLQFTIMTQNEELKKYLKIGTEVIIERKTNSKFDSLRSAGGYSGNIIVNNQISEYGIAGTNGPDHEKERHPRTVLGVTGDGQIMMGVIDGRNPSLNRVGVTLKEAAKVLNTYGCEEGIAFDGGGSSTLILRKNDQLSVVNYVSNTNQDLRNVCDAWLVVQREADIKLEQVLVNESYVKYKLDYFNKEQMDQVYLVFNGEKKLLDLKTEELQLEYTNAGKNYLYFEIHSQGKVIRSYCSISDTNNLEVSKIPPKDFVITDAVYQDGMLNLKLDYLDNAKMISKIYFVQNENRIPVKLSTRSASMTAEDNTAYYFDIYYEYFDRKNLKKTDSIKWLIVIQNGKCFVIKNNNSIFHYLLGDEMLVELRKNE